MWSAQTCLAVSAGLLLTTAAASATATLRYLGDVGAVASGLGSAGFSLAFAATILTFSFPAHGFLTRRHFAIFWGSFFVPIAVLETIDESSLARQGILVDSFPWLPIDLLSDAAVFLVFLFMWLLIKDDGKTEAPSVFGRKRAPLAYPSRQKATEAALPPPPTSSSWLRHRLWRARRAVVRRVDALLMLTMLSYCGIRVLGSSPAVGAWVSLNEIATAVLVVVMVVVVRLDVRGIRRDRAYAVLYIWV